MALDFTGIQKPTSNINFSGMKKLSDLPASTTGAPTGGLSSDSLTGGAAAGMEKGALSTLGGLSDFGNFIARQTFGRVTNAIQGKGFTAPPAEKSIISPGQAAVSPVGTGENIGYYGEKVAEFMTPAGIESKAITAGDKAIESLNIVDKLGPTVGKVAQTALKGTVRALTGLTSGTVVGTAQSGDVKKGLETGVVNAIASPLIEGVVSTFPKAAEILQKVSMRLSPAMKRDFSDKLVGVTKYLLDNNVVGTAAQQSEKLDGMFTKTEKSIQQVFEDNPDKFVSKEQAKLKLDQLKDVVAKDNPDAQAAIKQVDDAKANLDFQYGSDKIPLARFNDLKRNTFGNAFNKAGSKVLSDVEFALGDAYKSLIEDASKGLKFEGKDIANFNQDYGKLITARKFLAASESKNGGLLEKIFSSIVSGGLGSVFGPIGASAGAVAGPLVEKPVVDAATSIAGNLLNKAAAPGLSGVLKQAPKLGLPFVSK